METNEEQTTTYPTPEQVEAAARAMRERSTWPSMHWPDIHGVDHIDTSKALALAALVAAAGVPASGSTSDGHHTFDELYDYRMLYNAHAAHGWLAAGIPVVKSWKHSDGDLCFGGGWFIVTATLPTGQVSNHYKAEHWGLFAVPEVDLPPEYDGHTPDDAAERLRAAAGVTPQEPEVESVKSAIYAGVGGLVGSYIPAYKAEQAAREVLKVLRISILAAPVQVDEAKLASLLQEHRPSQWRSFANDTIVYRCCGQDFGRLTGKPRKADRDPRELWQEHMASKLAEWLRGGGQ